MYSPSLWPHLPLLCILNIRQLEQSIPTRVWHTCTRVCGTCTRQYCLSTHVYLIPVLLSTHTLHTSCTHACALYTRVCTRFLMVTLHTCTRVWERSELEFYRITLLTRFVNFIFCVFETVPFVVVCGGLILSCSLLHPLLQCFTKHLRSIRTCRNGIWVR